MRSAAIALFGLTLAVCETAGQTVTGVADPYNAEYFSCAGKPDGRLFNDTSERGGYNGFRIRADLNFDGRQDLILSKSNRSNETQGNDIRPTGCAQTGCAVAIFLMQPDKTYTSLRFWLHPLNVGLNRIGPGEGELVTYGRNGPEGRLVFNRITADSVTLTNVQIVHIATSDSDKALYDFWFAGSMALKPEFAVCRQGKLQWSSSYN